MKPIVITASELGIKAELPKVEEKETAKPTPIEILASVEEKIKEIKAECGCCAPVCVEVEVEVESEEEDDSKEKMEECMYKCDYLMSELSYVYRALSDIREMYWKHVEDGHLPKIPSASKLAEILTILKLDKDYVVEPKVIYASDGKKLESLTISPK
jgi:hypothetical protein